jgi:1,2-diacylglycerol 3-beta-glucosyltransferase
MAARGTPGSILSIESGSAREPRLRTPIAVHGRAEYARKPRKTDMAWALAARIFDLALFGIGCAILASCLYLLTLAVAGFLHVPPVRTGPPRSRILVLIPAHNEEKLVGRCIASLSRQTYPRRLRRITVIADNCSDRTADVARAHGASVLVRDDPNALGKGHAVRWALDRVLTQERRADVIVMVDADSVAEPDLLRHLESELAAGAAVAQADYRILEPDASPRSGLVATGFLLFHRARLSGRAALRLPANLLGNGMAFKRDVFERVPWSAFTSVEDLEYSITLRIAGVRPVFVRHAVVRGPLPDGRRALGQQRMRWEGGRLFLLSRWLMPLLVGAVRRRDWALLDAAIDLAILPTGLLALVIGLGFVVAGPGLITGVLPPWAGLPWLVSVLVLPAYVVIGLRAADAPPSAYLALRAAPAYLVHKVFLYGRLLVGFDPRSWESASGDAESENLIDPDGDGIAWVAGIPVHMVDMGRAVDRVIDLVGQPEGGHVCTVNLDFVVSAQKDPEVSEVLQRSDLNVADGAPVAWLARLVGHRMPRVAGADLVPLVTRAAAERGIPVFFLGGEGNAAEDAAHRLSERYPALRVAGCYEPPRAALDELPTAEMLTSIRKSGAGIVLVGLGHPKQEHWIARNRKELGSSVAIGVGGCFDFISARRRRAPRWIQDAGFEWFYRLAQEPGRLSARYTRDAAWFTLLTARAIRRRRQLVPQAKSAPAWPQAGRELR